MTPPFASSTLVDGKNKQGGRRLSGKKVDRRLVASFNCGRKSHEKKGGKKEGERVTPLSNHSIGKKEEGGKKKSESSEKARFLWMKLN